MIAYIVTALVAFGFYLVLTAGSWTPAEFVAGGIIAALVAAITGRVYGRHFEGKKTPLRSFLLVIYAIGPLFAEMARANIDVAVRVFTGKIRPGIIKYDPETKTDFGTMVIGNSITLTPGTLTVDIDQENNHLYVHVLNIEPEKEKEAIWKGKDIFALSDLSAWVRRMTE